MTSQPRRQKPVRRVVGGENRSRPDVVANRLVHRHRPPDQMANPGGDVGPIDIEAFAGKIVDCRQSGNPSQYLPTAILASRPGPGQPLSIGKSGAARSSDKHIWVGDGRSQITLSARQSSPAPRSHPRQVCRVCCDRCHSRNRSVVCAPRSRAADDPAAACARRQRGDDVRRLSLL